MERELFDAYLATAYVVCLAGSSFTVRVGAPSPEADALLESGEATWIHLTAWNPGSRQLPQAENDGRQAALEHALIALGHRVLPAWGVGADGAFVERHCFATGVSRERAELLGRLFDQNAIVVGDRGQPAKLVNLVGAS